MFCKFWTGIDEWRTSFLWGILSNSLSWTIVWARILILSLDAIRIHFFKLLFKVDGHLCSFYHSFILAIMWEFWGDWLITEHGCIFMVQLAEKFKMEESATISLWLEMDVTKVQRLVGYLLSPSPQSVRGRVPTQNVTCPCSPGMLLHCWVIPAFFVFS